MHTCAKMRCEAEPVARISLRYAEREVVVADIRPEQDPHALDLCREHTERMTAPRGWIVRDARSAATATR